MFKGPYVRLRLPFRPAADGWQRSLGVVRRLHAVRPPGGGVRPAVAAADLGPDKPRPLPTLVTTGTGSGKTEAFLYPILDHVLRARRDGVTGTKALILYPMNALANDQAQRLADLLTTPPGAGRGHRRPLHRAGRARSGRRVTADGLITDRAIIRDAAPDILLTNYKMLDQLLLRHEDQRDLWRQSAPQPAVPGAGRVPHLRRRAGHRRGDAAAPPRPGAEEPLAATTRVTDDDRARPLGRITPVATSATLGDKGDPAAMLDFAQTVFGDEFDDDAVVTESRLDLDEWTAGAADRIAAARARRRVDPYADDLASVERRRRRAGPGPTRPAGPSPSSARSTTPPPTRSPRRSATTPSCCSPSSGRIRWSRSSSRRPEQAVHLSDLAAALFPEPRAARHRRRGRADHVPDAPGRGAQPCPGRRRPRRARVDLHLWVRELTRIDRAAELHGPVPVERRRRAGRPAERRRPSPRSPPSPPSTAGTAAGPAGASAWRRSAPTSTPTTTPSGATTPPARAGSAPCSTRPARPSTRPATG